MEKYVVSIFGYNEDPEYKERLGAAFLVRPNFLITARHVILDETGKKYQNKCFYFEDQFYPLNDYLYVSPENDYKMGDTVYHDLGIFLTNITFHKAFHLSERNIEFNEKYSTIGFREKENVKAKSILEVTISFPQNAYKMYNSSQWLSIENCLIIKEILSPGDSGSPIFKNDEAIGMVVYGILDSEKKTVPKGGMYGTVALKASYIKKLLENLSPHSTQM
jgi:V8-like Glu-specific endopeptidase